MSELEGTPDPFWDAYNEAIEALADLGLKFPRRARLPIFKLYHMIDRDGDTWEDDYALWKLDVLREVISNGYEPPHKNGRYT